MYSHVSGILFLQFLNVPSFRNVTLQCLTEIGKLSFSVCNGAVSLLLLFFMELHVIVYACEFCFYATRRVIEKCLLVDGRFGAAKFLIRLRVNALTGCFHVYPHNLT